MDPRTNGPVVFENMETSAEGIFASGNVVHVHDLVDFVTAESQKAGRSAAEYVKNGEAEDQTYIELKNGDCVGYTVPQKIRPANVDKMVEVMFRVRNVYRDVAIKVTSGGEELACFKREHMAPGEMEKIVIPKAFLDKVKNGEIIEIITTKSPNRGPSRDWLKIVHTSEARNKIRNWFKKTQREENILEGKIEVDREFKRNQIAVNDEQLEQLLMGVGKKYQVGSLDDFYAALGYGGINLTRLMPRIKEAYSKMVNPAPPPAPLTKEEVPLTKSKHTSSGGVEVEGIDNCLVKFAKCCNPLPGDSIVGFITRGFGVSVHKADCPNVLAAKNLEENSERWVKVKWSASSRDSFKSTLQLVGLDRQGLFADISIALSAMRVPIFAINARSLQNGFADVMITIGISNVEHLTSIIARLQKIQGVESVQRSSQ